MFKGDTKKILANTFWMLFDKVFILVLNLLVTVKIANYFGVSEYGNYQYAVSVVAILEILVTIVDGRVVKKRYLDCDPDVVVFNASICRILFSVISAVVGLGLVLIVNRGIEYTIMFSILLLNVIITNLRFGMVNRFEYLLKSKKTVIAADIATLLSSLLQLVAVSAHCSIIIISVIAAVSSCVNLLIVFVQYKKEFPKKERRYVDIPLVKEMIKESLPLAIAASCATIYTRCDLVMLGSMLTTAEVGIYSISIKLISVVQIAITPIRESVYPKLIDLYNKDRDAYAKRYTQITSLMTWVYIIGVTFSFIILPFAFKFLNEEYAEAFPVYKVYVLGTFFMYNAALRAGHYTLINRGSILMYSQIISVVLNIILSFFGIRMFGLYGAAIATVITQCISLLISNLFFGETGREVIKWQLKGLNPVYIFKH